jgi:hypothetical protein
MHPADVTADLHERNREDRSKITEQMSKFRALIETCADDNLVNDPEVPLDPRSMAPDVMAMRKIIDIFLQPAEIDYLEITRDIVNPPIE